MKPPYYIVTALCLNKECKRTYFTKEMKKVDRVSTGGRAYRTTILVCDQCGQWADVTEIEEVK